MNISQGSAGEQLVVRGDFQGDVQGWDLLHGMVINVTVAAIFNYSATS